MITISHQHVSYYFFSNKKNITILDRTLATEPNPVSIAVSPQVTVTNPAVGSHYFPQGEWLPSQPQSITDVDGQRRMNRSDYCEVELIILLGN